MIAFSTILTLNSSSICPTILLYTLFPNAYNKIKHKNPIAEAYENT